MTECMVIGAGLAGLSAALTLAQRRLDVEVVATSFSETRAGRLAVTTTYPGGSAAATGQSLVEHVLSQLKETKARLTTGTVQTVAAGSPGWDVTFSTGEKRSVKSLIIATGIVHHGHAPLPGEDTFFGKGVFYQMQTDGPLYAGKTLVAAGKSAAIVETVVACHKWFEKIHLVVPATKMELSDDLSKRLQQCNTVDVIYSASIKEVQGLAGVGSVLIQAAGQDRQLHAQAVWLPTHIHHGNTACLEGIITLSDHKTPLVTQQLATNQPGIFACGDVLCAEYQHPSIAAAQGVVAAYGCEQYLKTLG